MYYTYDQELIELKPLLDLSVYPKEGNSKYLGTTKQFCLSRLGKRFRIWLPQNSTRTGPAQKTFETLTGIMHKLLPLNWLTLGSVTHPCPLPVTGNGHAWVPLCRWYTVDVFSAHINGPIRGGMTLLTTNEIAELVVFYRLFYERLSSSLLLIMRQSHFTIF